jgi:hypothetical protein
MLRRIVVPVAASVVVVGGAGAFALAHTDKHTPALTHSTAHYTAPDGGWNGSLTTG